MPIAPADRQCPPAGSLFLDHVTHEVAELEPAARLLAELGFAPTPRSAYAPRAVGAGTANCCVMLEDGYLAWLAPGPGAPLRPGRVRSVVLGTPAPGEERERLARHGFAPLPLEPLEREVELDGATRSVRLEVARMPPGTMPEGELRFVRHLTPELLWQPRWLAHANGVHAIAAAFVVADDVAAVAARYAQCCALLPRPSGPWVRLATTRGELVIGSRRDWSELLGAAPAPPAFAGCALACRDARAFAERCARAGVAARAVGDGLYAAQPPAALGGSWLFGEPAALARWRETR